VEVRPPQIIPGPSISNSVAGAQGRGYKDSVRLLRQYHFVWTFLAVLVFCSVMVLRQFKINHQRHNELREAFILLHSKGYTNQAERLYYRLLVQVERVPHRVLFDDFQRTMMLVEPDVPQPKNLIWKYHRTVGDELEKRSPKAFAHALKLAEETE
jgi:hypothetical protein